MSHDMNCDFWLDQYPWECNCGFTKERASWFVPYVKASKAEIIQESPQINGPPKVAEIYSLSKARRRESAPLFELPNSLLSAAEIFGFELPSRFESFYLRRSKRGVQVFIKGGRLTLNLSSAAKTYPPNFSAARQWVAAIGERHNWQLVETKHRL